MSAEITVSCEMCSGTGDATHGDRHTGTNMDRCRTCGGTGQVPARSGESRETSWPDAVPGASAAPTIHSPVTILYTNWRGETAVRRIANLCACFGSNEWHPEPQWLIDALDLDKDARRLFAMSGIKAWGEEAIAAATRTPGDALAQARRLAADEAEERFRGDLAALFLSGAGDDHPWVRSTLRGIQAAGGISVRWRAPDGWCPWPMSTSHALRMALYVNDEAVATLEAFSMNGPWYANAVTPEGESKRLGAGGSLHGAVAWCEKLTGYLTPGAKYAAEQQLKAGGEQ